MKTTSLTLVAAAVLMASGIALAAAPPKFAAADANGDGGVDATEFAATGIQKDFGELDADGNGEIDEAEMAFPAQMMARMQAMHGTGVSPRLVPGASAHLVVADQDVRVAVQEVVGVVGIAAVHADAPAALAAEGGRSAGGRLGQRAHGNSK